MIKYSGLFIIAVCSVGLRAMAGTVADTRDSFSSKIRNVAVMGGKDGHFLVRINGKKLSDGSDSVFLVPTISYSDASALARDLNDGKSIDLNKCSITEMNYKNCDEISEVVR